MRHRFGILLALMCLPRVDQSSQGAKRVPVHSRCTSNQRKLRKRARRQGRLATSGK